MTLVTLIVPANVMDSWGTDLRMAPLAVMLAILAIGPATTPRRERVLLTAGIALFAVRCTATLGVWQVRSQSLTARLALLDAVPAGSRLGFVSAEQNCRTPWPIRPDHVLAAYAVVRREAFANTMFHTPGADLVWPRHPGDRGALDRGFAGREGGLPWRHDRPACGRGAAAGNGGGQVRPDLADRHVRPPAAGLCRDPAAPGRYAVRPRRSARR